LNTGHGDINPDLLKIFETNFSSQRVVSVYTGWLEVGHIDEVISFVKHDAGQFGFKMLINSPALFIQMWTEAAAANAEACLFDRPIEAGFDQTHSDQLLGIKAGQEVKYPYSGFMLPSVNGCTIRLGDNASLQNLIRFNQFLQAVIDKIEIKLCRELGLRPADVIKLPILFTGPDELYNTAIAATGEMYGVEKNEEHPETFMQQSYSMIFDGAQIGGVYHLSSNLANSIISPTFMICDMPHSTLPIKAYLESNIVSAGGITHIYYVDTWNTVKYQHGGLHCFTGETRDFTARAAAPTHAGGGRRNRRSKRRNRTRRVRRTARYRR
jgi:hypothetical protein